MAAVQIGRTRIAGMFRMLGYMTAHKWDKKRFEDNIAKLSQTGTLDMVPEGAADEDVATFKQVLTALGNGDAVELFDDTKADADKEDTKPADKPQDRPVAAPAGETTADPEPDADAPEATQEAPAPAADKPRRGKKAADAPAPQKKATKKAADPTPARGQRGASNGKTTSARGKKATPTADAEPDAKPTKRKTAKGKTAKPKPAKTTPGGLKVHHPKNVDPSRLVLGPPKGDGPAHIRESRTRGRLAGVAIAKFGLDHGVTDELVAFVDDAMGRANPYQTIWACKMAWHAIQGYLKGDLPGPAAAEGEAKTTRTSKTAKATAAPRKKTAKKAAPKKATKKAPAKAAAKKTPKRKTAKA